MVSELVIVVPELIFGTAAPLAAVVVLALAEASPDATTAVTTATSPVTAASLNLALVCRLLHHPFT